MNWRLVLLCASLLLECQQFQSHIRVRHHNDVIVVTTDGYVCYGTHRPRAFSCHKAIDWSPLEVK